MLSGLTGFGGIWVEFIRRPTLAIGYSLRDPDLQLLLHWSQERLRGFSHSLFLLIPRIEEEDRQLLTLLPGVVVLQYDPAGGHRRAVLDVLQELKRDLDAASRRLPSDLEVHGAMLRQFNRRVRSLVHDAKQPVYACALNSELLSSTATTEEQRSLVGKIRESAEQVIKGFDAVSSMVRASEGHLEPAMWPDVRSALVEDLKAMQYTKVVASIASRAEVEIPIGAQLYSVLVRILVDNAIEASSGQHVFDVSLTVTIAEADRRERLVAEVRDTGPGIASAIKNKLFEPNASPRAGRGLGLYLLRTLSQEVGGYFDIITEPGRGTLAMFWLPVRRIDGPPATAVASPAPESSAGALAGRRIVVVDDNAQVREGLRDLLTRWRATVLTYDSYKTAAAEILGHEECPNCIVSDVLMPQGSGFDLLRSVRSRWPRAAFVFLTGWSDDLSRSPLFEQARVVQKGSEAKVLFEEILGAIADATS